MTITFIIEATEWSFEETLPFEVIKMKDVEQDYELPLFDEDGNETDRVLLPKCRVIELEGDEDTFNVIFEAELIKHYEQTNLSDDEIEIQVQLAVDKNLWNQGEDSGIFYSWENLPEKLKELEIK